MCELLGRATAVTARNSNQIWHVSCRKLTATTSLGSIEEFLSQRVASVLQSLKKKNQSQKRYFVGINYKHFNRNPWFSVLREPVSIGYFADGVIIERNPRMNDRLYFRVVSYPRRRLFKRGKKSSLLLVEATGGSDLTKGRCV